MKVKSAFIGLMKSFGFLLLLSAINAIMESLFELKTNLIPIANTISYALGIIIVFLTYQKTLIPSIKSFKSDFKKTYRDFVISILFLIASFIATIIITKSLGILSSNEILMRNKINTTPIMILSAVLLIPICEEFIIRLPYIKDNNKISFIVYTIVFTLMHVSFSSINETLFIIPYLLMSISFSYSYFKTNNIFMSIILHSINNIIALMLILI